MVGRSSPRSRLGAPRLSECGGAGPETAPGGLTRSWSELRGEELEASEWEACVLRPASDRRMYLEQPHAPPWPACARGRSQVFEVLSVLPSGGTDDPGTA